MNGDGRADYIYNRDGTRELWGLLSTATGVAADRMLGARKHGVRYAGESEWLIKDAEGRVSYIYNRDTTRECWVLRWNNGTFLRDRLWGVRAWGVGNNGRSEWIRGEGRSGNTPTQLHTRDGTRELWMTAGRTYLPLSTVRRSRRAPWSPRGLSCECRTVLCGSRSA